MILQIWKSKELLIALVKRDLKVRYKSSVLGFFWSVGKPLLLMAVLLIVFSIIFRLEIRNPGLPFALHLLPGILAWTFFAGAMFEALTSILGNANLIKKVKLPSEVFPLSSIISNLVHFILALSVLFFFMIIFKMGITWTILLLPLVILLQTLFIIGPAFLVSSLFVFYRDVGSILEIFMMAWFYITPIFYPYYFAEKELVKFWDGLLLNIYLLNPMAVIALTYRRVLYASVLSPPKNIPEIPDKTLLIYIFITILISLILIYLCHAVFKKMSKRFADEL